MDSSSNAEVSVFVDTNLGTHIAMSVSADTTAGEFKRKLVNVHLNCLPELGGIIVNDIMVKRKSYLYYLPESFPLKQAFPGSKRTWFIYTKACLWSQSDQTAISTCMATEVVDSIKNHSNIADGTKVKNCTSTEKSNVKCRRKKRRIKRFHCLKAVFQAALEGVHNSKTKTKNRKMKKTFQQYYAINGPEKALCNKKEVIIDEEKWGMFACTMEDECKQNWNCSPAVRTPSETLSESVSVSGIIRKYFPIDDDLTSASEVSFTGNQSEHEEKLNARIDNNCSTAHIERTPELVAKTPTEVRHFPWPNDRSVNSRGKLRTTNVGKRLLVASNNLGISAGCKRPLVSLCRMQNGNLFQPKSSSVVRALVFDPPDDDDDD